MVSHQEPINDILVTITWSDRTIIDNSFDYGNAKKWYSTKNNFVSRVEIVSKTQIVGSFLRLVKICTVMQNIYIFSDFSY